MTEEDFLVKLREAIREPHAAIHRMNLSRINLCIPPQILRPTLYALGLSRYAEIFYGLEEEWVALIGDPTDWIGEGSLDHIPDSSPDSSERMKSLLRILYVPELLRTRSLQADLSFLQSVDPSSRELVLEPNPGLEIRRYIHECVEPNPHRLVAWIWIMYSAVLYGGRELRSQLLKAGPEFWDLSATELKARRTPCPLSFWHMDDDGVVKAKFRTLMVDAGRLLTPQEKQEILDESLQIFQKLELLTLSLDEEVKQTHL
ncbi:uncharacterized protein N7484_007766 [Penicillium longicatenatum]|uniref:uncharacterized protein n=1 Tax=Penicillium longicatenatum TaxID=1561947 RepID=UPI0025475001|nr:uncharacterized protein N7484_007766 [Penicillium longicatenatum]KAJ5639904.1 hypothetical protein N7484_007766 [Penicillium longicatenatum]